MTMSVKKRKALNSVFTVFKYLVLVIGSFISLAPVCVCVLTAFKTEEEYNTSSVLALPKSFTYFENFKVAMEKANMLRGFFNTALVLIVVLTASIFIGSMLALSLIHI